MTYDSINLIVPTYKRIKDTGRKNPDGGHIFEGPLAKFIQSSAEKTVKRTSDYISYCFVVNQNDRETMECIMTRMAGYNFEIIVENEPQPHLAKFYNMAYEQTKFNEPNRLVSMLGDDMVFETPQYQDFILDEVNKRNGDAFVYCNDAYIAGLNCAVNFFTTRKVVDATGKPFMKPDCQAEMIDLIWTEIANMANIAVYLSDVVIFHEHMDRLPENLRDESWRRLNPIRQAAHKIVASPEGQTAQQAYINEAAKALVAKGIGHLK